MTIVFNTDIHSKIYIIHFMHYFNVSPLSKIIGDKSKTFSQIPKIFKISAPNRQSASCCLLLLMNVTSLQPLALEHGT